MKVTAWAAVGCLVVAQIASPPRLNGQEARRRWDRLCQIRQEKFDRILPEVMRENAIDMWIVAQKEGHNDPMYEHLGRGYTGTIGYYVFTDRGGDRIERVALGITGAMLEQCRSYDRVEGGADSEGLRGGASASADWDQHLGRDRRR